MELETNGKAKFYKNSNTNLIMSDLNYDHLLDVHLLRCAIWMPRIKLPKIIIVICLYDVHCDCHFRYLGTSFINYYEHQREYIHE